MPFREVSKKGAVMKAIKEFNDLGREKFLEKYRFGRAKSYFLIHGGRRYDCKPILWAAYQHQFGCPLEMRASQGVAKLVQPHLESLGFFIINVNATFSEINDDMYLSVLASSNLSREERLKRLALAPKKPEFVKITIVACLRNPHVIAETLYRANGVCELCKKPAPFVRAKDGSPYLEVHHIKRLADGGEDTTDNTIALCPNCHRKSHFGSINHATRNK